MAAGTARQVESARLPRAQLSNQALITAGAGDTSDAAACPDRARLIPKNDAPNQELANVMNFRRFKTNLLLSGSHYRTRANFDSPPLAGQHGRPILSPPNGQITSSS
jgi:hypothetical protein